MKKLTKLLAVLLMLALVIGVVAIGVMATSSVGNDYVADSEEGVAGETIVYANNFDAITPINYGSASTVQSDPAIASEVGSKNLTNKYKGLRGDVSIVSATQGPANNYLQVSTTSTGTGKPYAYISTGNGASASNPGKSLAENTYNVVDFDVYFPEKFAHRYDTRWDAHFVLRAFNASGTRVYPSDIGYKITNPSSGTINNLGGATNGISFQQSTTATDGSGVIQTYINSPTGWVTQSGGMNVDQWTHYTLIFESIVNDAGTADNTADDYLDLTLYVATNGVVTMVYEYVYDATPTDNSVAYKGDLTGLYITEVRFDFSNSDVVHSIRYDNIAYRTYSTEYEGNLASLLAGGKGTDITSWDRNAYDLATMPFGTTVAKIGDTEYTNLVAAVKNAEAGSTIDMVANSTDNVIIDKAVTINLNGYTVSNVVAKEGYFVSNSGSAISIKPENEALFKLTSGGVISYRETGTLADAITSADAGTTIYVYKDIALEGKDNNSVLSISKNITIDLQNHILEIKQGVQITDSKYTGQNAISISGSASVTFKNGSVYAYNFSSPTKAYPAFTPASGSTLTLENIKSYTGGLAYMYSGHNPTVNIIGGEHHMILSANGAWTGLIEMRGYVTFTATDASFYIANGKYLIVACNYNDNKDKTSGHSFTFNNCNIVAESASNNIIHYMNSKTEIAFNGCYIAASLRPSDTYSTDITNGLSKWGNGEITFGQGTYIASGANFSSGLTTTPDGYIFSEVSETKDISMNYSSGTFGTNFATALSNKGFTFTEKIVNENELIEKADFIITLGDEVTYVDGTIADAILAAKDGSTITCLYPVNIAGTVAGDTAILNIDKNLTIDLNGQTLTFLQYEKNHIGVSSGKTVTFKNGTIDAHYIDDETKGHTIFTPGSNSVVNLVDVDTNSAGLFKSWSNTGFTVNVTGGVHTSVGKGDHWGGFLQPRTVCTFTATEAEFYFGTQPFIYDVAYHANVSTNPVHTYTFTDCKIIGSSKNSEVIKYATNATSVEFNGCYIFGSINPSVYGSDVTAGYADMESITFGAGTYVASISSNLNILLPDGCSIYNINEAIDGNTYGKVVSTEDAMNSNYKFIVTANGVDTYYNTTFANIISIVNDANVTATIKLLSDTSYDFEDVKTWNDAVAAQRYEYYKHIKVSLTLDLNNRTLTFIEPQNNHLGIYFDKEGGTFTIKNGTIKAQLADGGLNSFPVFQLNKVGNYVFDNVKSYTAGLVYNYGQTGVNVQFIGGEHHIIGLAMNTSGGFVDTRGNTVVTATGTRFYSNQNRQMFTISNYKTTKVDKATSLTFTDCYFYNTTASRQVLMMNSWTTATFNNCVIGASLEPSKNTIDGTETDPIAGSITLGADTVMGSGTSISDAVTLASGMVNLYCNSAVEVEYNTYSNGTISTSTVSITPAYKVGTMSSAEYLVTIGGSAVYVPAGYTFDEIIGLVSNGGTIKLLTGVTYTVGANKSVGKGMTIDLNGQTLHIVQTTSKDCAAFYVSTTGQFTIMNGYITVENIQDTDKDNIGKVYPIVVNDATNSNIVIDGVHATVGGFVHNPNDKFMTLTVRGGSYHGITPVSHTNGTFVESRGNCSVYVSGTTFYLESTQLVASLSYKVASGSECNSQFTFDGCEIYRPSVTSTAIRFMNNYTWITFNDCKIHASLSGGRHDWDKTQTNAIANNVAEPTSANITLGEGTVVANGATAVAVVANGYNLLYSPVNVTFAPAGVTYTALTKVGASENVAYKLTVGGLELFADKTEVSFAEVISGADAGTTIYILSDISVITPVGADKYYATIDKALVIDLGGNTLYFSQSTKEYSVISITTTSGVEIMNGSIVFNINESYTTSTTPPESSSGPLFRINTNNATLTFTDIKGYGSTIAYSYDKTNLTINFNGGEYHVIRSVDLVGGGLVETRANTQVNMNGTTVVLSSGVPLFTLASYKEEGVRESSAILTNCTILGASETTNILQYLNNYNSVQFNNCMIYGSIDPSVNGTDSTNGGGAITDPVAGAVVLGNGTYISANATLREGVVVAETDRAIVETSKAYTFTLAIASGTIYNPENPSFAIESVNKIYSFGFVVGEPPLKNLTITWYKEDGKTVIIVQTVVEGTIGVIAPTYTPGDNNGWYKTGFDGWTNVNGSSDKVDLANFVVSDNVAFYPATKTDSTPTPYLSGAEYNLTLTGNITLNFYLPTTPEGVTVLGVYDEDGNIIPYKGVILPNGQYRRLYVVNTVGATALNTTSKLRVVFTVMHNGAPIELTQNITISPYRYAKGILEDSANATPVYSTATHTLIADMVRYSNVLSSVVNGSTITELDALLETYGDLCSTLPYDNGFAEYTTSVKDLAGYVKSISFEVSSYQPRWVFTFDASKKITDLKITIDGYYELPDENGYNFGSLTYEVDPEASEYSGNYLTTAYTQSVPMYNIDRVMTIIVTTEDGTVKTGTYSLNNYYANVNATGDELLAVREFLQAFRAFGITSSGYRYADGIKQAGAPTVDFFKCSHTHLGNWTANGGRYCSDCMTYIFSYEDYINNAGYGGQVYTSRDDAYNGKISSYSAIDYCHDRANEFYKKGNKVGCVAGNKVYYFGEALSYAGAVDEIEVITDTDWAGAYFVVDDEPYDIKDATYNKNVFGIRGPAITAPDGISYSNFGTDITSAIASALGTAEGAVILSPSTTNIGWSNGMPMLISLYDYSQTRYHRYGQNASKASSHEIILIDEFGNVNPTTPIEWDYVYNTDWYGPTPETATNTTPTYVAGSFKATAYPITASPIKISGLDNDGNISFTFENVANNNVTATSYADCNRGIVVRGSNVTLEGMKHIMTEDDTNTTPRQAYAGFIVPYLANNTVIKDMLVMNHLGHYVQNSSGTNTTNSLGSYEFGGSDSTYTSWINCKTTNLFWEDGSVTYRGMFGTNRMRNNYLKDCVLNSYDAHSGAYNTTIEDCTFEHINFVGQGDIILKNVVIYADHGGAGGIHLRQDYGSRWEGNIHIDGLDLRISTSYAFGYVDLVRAYYTNNDFGYTDKTSTSGNYLPFNIYANNVTISSYQRSTDSYTCTNGGIVDETLAESDVPLGIYSYYDYTLNEKSYNSTSDKNGQTPTTAIYFTGGSINSITDLATPTNAYFKDMMIYINGAVQSWCCGTAHTDSGKDGVCDNCKASIVCMSSNGQHMDTSSSWKVCDTCGFGIPCSASHPTKGSETTCATCGSKILDNSSCVTGDTLVMLADGSQKRIDELTGDELILVFDHYTGELTAVPIAWYENNGVEEYEVVTLTFSDGTVTRLIYEHGYFNKTLNKYVYIHADDCTEFIGDEFAIVGANGELTSVTLVNATVSYEVVGCYSITSAFHYGFIADGVLSIPGGIDGIFNIFEYGEDFAYDAEKMKADIDEYGLYTYEDFAPYATEEMFYAFNAKYFKVAVGKGIITFEQIVEYIEAYF